MVRGSALVSLHVATTFFQQSPSPNFTRLTWASGEAKAKCLTECIVYLKRGLQQNIQKWNENFIRKNSSSLSSIQIPRDQLREASSGRLSVSGSLGVARISVLRVTRSDDLKVMLGGGAQ
jgi:hypothetical protein